MILKTIYPRVKKKKSRQKYRYKYTMYKIRIITAYYKLLKSINLSKVNLIQDGKLGFCGYIYIITV